jgi:hypothetical protein
MLWRGRVFSDGMEEAKCYEAPMEICLKSRETCWTSVFLRYENIHQSYSPCPSYLINHMITLLTEPAN